MWHWLWSMSFSSSSFKQPLWGRLQEQGLGLRQLHLQALRRPHCPRRHPLIHEGREEIEEKPIPPSPFLYGPFLPWIFFFSGYPSYPWIHPWLDQTPSSLSSCQLCGLYLLMPWRVVLLLKCGDGWILLVHLCQCFSTQTPLALSTFLEALGPVGMHGEHNEQWLALSAITV